MNLVPGRKFSIGLALAGIGMCVILGAIPLYEGVFWAAGFEGCSNFMTTLRGAPTNDGFYCHSALQFLSVHLHIKDSPKDETMVMFNYESAMCGGEVYYYLHGPFRNFQVKRESCER